MDSSGVIVQTCQHFERLTKNLETVATPLLQTATASKVILYSILHILDFVSCLPSAYVNVISALLEQSAKADHVQCMFMLVYQLTFGIMKQEKERLLSFVQAPPSYEIILNSVEASSG